MASSVIDVIAGCVTAVRRLAEFVRVAVNLEYAGFASFAGFTGRIGKFLKVYGCLLGGHFHF